MRVLAFASLLSLATALPAALVGSVETGADLAIRAPTELSAAAGGVEHVARDTAAHAGSNLEARGTVLNVNLGWPTTEAIYADINYSYKLTPVSGSQYTLKFWNTSPQTTYTWKLTPTGSGAKAGVSAKLAPNTNKAFTITASGTGYNLQCAN